MGGKSVRTTDPTALKELVNRLGQTEASNRIGVAQSTISQSRTENSVRLTTELAARWVLSTLPGGENAHKNGAAKSRFHLLVRDDQLQSTLTFCSAMKAGVQQFLVDFKSVEVNYHFLIITVEKEKVDVMDAFFNALEIERGRLVE